MKLLSIITILILGAQAHASFYQITCSTSDNSLIMNNGHVNNELSVKVYPFERHDGQPKGEQRLKLNQQDLEIVTTNAQIIKEKSRNSCEEGSPSRSGYWSSDTDEVKEVTIRKKDGSMFNEGVFHLSEDRKTINAIVLCHSHINSMVACD